MSRCIDCCREVHDDAFLCSLCETKNKITFLIQPKLQYKDRILSVDIHVFHEDEMEFPYLTATLDWQDGLHIWQSECIDPPFWSKISEQLLLGMKEAKKLIDPVTYCAGEPE